VLKTPEFRERLVTDAIGTTPKQFGDNIKMRA